MSKCQHSGAHHSADLVEVYYGRSEPVILCGKHAMGNIDWTKVSKS